MRHAIEKDIVCQVGTLALAVWGARHRGTFGLLAVGLSALIVGYNLGRSALSGTANPEGDADAEEPTPESAELGTSDAGPP